MESPARYKVTGSVGAAPVVAVAAVESTVAVDTVAAPPAPSVVPALSVAAVVAVPVEPPLPVGPAKPALELALELAALEVVVAAALPKTPVPPVTLLVGVPAVAFPEGLVLCAPVLVPPSLATPPVLEFEAVVVEAGPAPAAGSDPV